MVCHVLLDDVPVPVVSMSPVLVVFQVLRTVSQQH